MTSCATTGFRVNVRAATESRTAARAIETRWRARDRGGKHSWITAAAKTGRAKITTNERNIYYKKKKKRKKGERGKEGTGKKKKKKTKEKK